MRLVLNGIPVEISVIQLSFMLAIGVLAVPFFFLTHFLFKYLHMKDPKRFPSKTPFGASFNWKESISFWREILKPSYQEPKYKRMIWAFRLTVVGIVVAGLFHIVFFLNRPPVQ